MFPTSITPAAWQQQNRVANTTTTVGGDAEAFQQALQRASDTGLRPAALNNTMVEYLTRAVQGSLNSQTPAQGGAAVQTRPHLVDRSAANWIYQSVPNGGVVLVNPKHVNAVYMQQRVESHVAPGQVNRSSVGQVAKSAFGATHQNGGGMADEQHRREVPRIALNHSPAARLAEVTGGRRVAAQTVTTSPNIPFAGLIERASVSSGVDERLLRSVIYVGSHFDPRAVSAEGAQGLVQLKPQVWSDMGVTDPFEAEQNVMGGSRYLRTLLDRYQGQRDLALAAMHWGVNQLERNPDAIPDRTADFIHKVAKLLDADEGSQVMV
ncbi:Lytic transglycosylase, catalytic [Magnetococcus marinus MC-1]|uniref:Lytic transglycosylase, catalytic n=2 Tax=Magnetococcus TaxID=162171 RepID=A0L537_MAGMM|nr:Lytic transglycosylase, catalytic [Magnetococcus marinus MC-1]